MSTPAKRDATKAKAVRMAAGRRSRVRIVDSELQERLIKGAYLADAGEVIDTSGLSDDEFLALLRR